MEIVEYFSYMNAYDIFLDELTKDILDGNAPDLIDVRSMPAELLSDKGFFEDLTPCFQQSSIVGKKDILDSVWEAGTYGKEMQFVVPWFSLDSYVIRENNLSGKKWDLEEFVRLLSMERGKNIFLYRGDYTERVLLEALYANMERFCEIESGTCDFTNDEFTGLLEAVGRRGDQREAFQGGISDIEMWEQITSDEVLLCTAHVSSIANYNRARQALGEGFWWVGYPSGEGQRVTLTKEERKSLRELAENAYLHTYRIFDPVYQIVLEESDAYFAGDRTAEETARIIENRVQLYLDERKQGR